MPNVNWSDTVKKRAELFLRGLLAYVLDLREDYRSLESSWKDEFSNQPKLLIESRTQDLEKLGQFANRNYFYEVRDRLEDLGILDDHSTNTKYKGNSHFTLKLWSKDIETNIRELNKAWQTKRPKKSKQIASKEKEQSVDSRFEDFKKQVLAVTNPINTKSPEKLPSFVGREQEIRDINRLVSEGAKVICIKAEGGIGKTTLAQEWFRTTNVEL